METVLKFTVDRKRWLRGEGERNSLLLRESDGKMCCLGFACLAAGHTESDIRGVATPTGISMERHGRCLLPSHSSRSISWAMEWNDCPVDKEFTEAKREALITEKLAEVGIEVVFEG
jgi:hypothetical protein